MSHFRFPRISRSVEQGMTNSGALIDELIRQDDLSLISNTSRSNILSSTSSRRNSNSSNSSASNADSSDSSTILAPRQPNRVVDERHCWICFGDSTDSQGKWVKPCKCTLEAHQSCLLDWIAENQKASPKKKVNCPQCATPYSLAETNTATLLILTLVDSFVRTSAPYITVLGIGCSLLVTCTTYGAFSVMTLFGQRDGERLIGNPNAWTFKTWVGLPLVPVLLVSTRTRWGDAILPVAAVSLLRATGNTPQNIRLTWPLSPALTIGIMPWVSLFYKNSYRLFQRYITKSLSLQEQQSSVFSWSNTSSTRRLSNNRGTASAAATTVDISDRERDLELDMINGRDASSIGLSLIETLLWPVISSVMGGFLNRFKCIRQNFPDPFQRNVLGGCVFVVVKDLGNLLYKYERICQHRSRRVKSYEEVLKSTDSSRQTTGTAAANN